MITAIELENFKGIGERVRIPIRPLTLLFGPNSAGKSTVLQAMHYVKEILERGNLDPDRTQSGGDSLDLGGFEALVHGHDVGRPIRLRLDVALPSEGLPEYPRFDSDEEVERRAAEHWEHGEVPRPTALLRKATSAFVELEVAWDATRNAPFLASYTAGLDGCKFASIATDDKGANYFLSEINVYHPMFFNRPSRHDTKIELPDDQSLESLYKELVFAIPVFYLVSQNFPSFDKTSLKSVRIGVGATRCGLPAKGRPLQFAPRWSQASDDDENEAVELQLLLDQVMVGSLDLLRQALNGFRYLGPLRQVPGRNYSPQRTPDEGRWASGLALWDKLATGTPEFVKEVSDWLGEEWGLGTGYRLPDKAGDALRPKAPLRVELLDTATGVALHPRDVGVGISQVLPVVVAALLDEQGVLAVEQPELHMHPSVQVGLGDLFLSQAIKRQRTFLIETHSEHLLLRVLRRVRETRAGTLPEWVPPVAPDQVGIVYAEKTEEGAAFTQLQIDEKGESVGEWPYGFFAERAKELF
jgi:hypothetical protein